MLVTDHRVTLLALRFFHPGLKYSILLIKLTYQYIIWIVES